MHVISTQTKRPNWKEYTLIKDLRSKRLKERAIFTLFNLVCFIMIFTVSCLVYYKINIYIFQCATSNGKYISLRPQK